jgi:DNA gyrase subunit A
MYDGGYRPDKQFSKCSRVVGDVMGQFHPHGDSAIYDTLVRLVQDWNLRYPLVWGQGNFGSPGNDPAAAPRYTECKMAPLAMEMVRDIDEETVDFQDNYDGRTQEPTILPSRFPNLLVNGSIGIAVGMATNIPPHNLREVAEAAKFSLEHPELSGEALVEELIKIVKGPDFPTGAQILGRRGIEDAYRTGRGSITMRAVVNVEELHGRTCLVVTELPYQVNPDNLALKIAELVKEGKLTGIADIRDETSGRTGQRLVVVLKKDAVARVVLNNLYKYTQLQENFGANMLALVDGVPRTLSLDGFISHWITHQIEIIVRRTQYRLKKAEERAHILRGYLKALDALDAVIALIRKSQTVEDARDGLIKLLKIDELQARAILNMQLRQLAALERQKIIDEAAELENEIKGYQKIIKDESLQRKIVGEELDEIVAKYGDDRRSEIMMGFDGDVTVEDLIPVEEMVVTLTSGGYIKRTRSSNYRIQHRGGKGVRGASLRADDVVQNFIVSTTHHWLMFFTNTGRVFRSKVYEIQEAGRDAKGQHVANLLALQPDERVVEVLDLKDYQQSPYLVLATRSGLVKKTSLELYDTARTGGIIAIKLRDGDELVNAMLVNEENFLLLVSRKGMSICFKADNATLRPMGRDTSGVVGMKFRKDDELLSASVIGSAGFVFVVTEGGYAKRTASEQYRVQNRGGLGIKVAKLDEKRGDLVGSLIVDENDEVLVVLASGKVIRTNASEVPAKGRDTMGVVFARFEEGDSVLSLAKNSERNLESNEEGADVGEPVQPEQ